MEYIETESSNIKKVGYDAENSILEIWFHSGGKYWYFEFPDDAWCNLQDILESDESVGKYFHRAIKGKFSHINITYFSQDIEFDAILIQNTRNLGQVGREYLSFSLLCEKHSWDFSDAWDKSLGRTEWFELQPEVYRNVVYVRITDLNSD